MFMRLNRQARRKAAREAKKKATDLYQKSMTAAEAVKFLDKDPNIRDDFKVIVFAKQGDRMFIGNSLDEAEDRGLVISPVAGLYKNGKLQADCLANTIKLVANGQMMFSPGIVSDGFWFLGDYAEIKNIFNLNGQENLAA
jgi:hypothetical protein